MGKFKTYRQTKELEAETMLVTCLDDYGMTNEQAFTKIGKELGTVAEQHVRDLVEQWNKGDRDGNSKV